jgi:hypothetical protein
MTTQQTAIPFTEAEIKEFTDRLEAWAQHLSPRDRHILSAVLARAAGVQQGDVHG